MDMQFCFYWNIIRYALQMRKQTYWLSRNVYLTGFLPIYVIRKMVVTGMICKHRYCTQNEMDLQYGGYDF